jgi:hypothetical protein
MTPFVGLQEAPLVSCFCAAAHKQSFGCWEQIASQSARLVPQKFALELPSLS